MSLLEKAGAVVLSHKDPTNIVLLYRGHLLDWSFPKGHVEPGESFAQTAAREVQEETGLIVTIDREIGSTQYTHPNGEQIRVHMFLARSQDDTTFKKEHMGDQVIWIPLDQVCDRLSYKGDRKFFASFLEEMRLDVDR
ncbi:TPA: hypothetical protein DEB00_02370 [Candidatus Uhrbacteria bacterium]|nr:hypothetical protein [Candidatus Uhrbacteria bacterium]